MILPGRDMHNHLLPGVDDGFREAANSLKAIERMAAAGCREFVFTPHMNPDVYPDCNEAHYRRVYESFVSQIPAEWGVKTALAAEYMVVQGFEERADDPSLLAFEDKSILIEMSYYYPSPNLEEAIFNLVIQGYKPILAHPERYQFISGKAVKQFEHYCDMGCRLQLNFLSLTGAYGPESLKTVKYLLDAGLYSFVATDLHSLSQLERILTMSPSGFFLRRKFNKAFPQLAV